MFSRDLVLLIFVIGLACFTHLWNPIGFPYPEFDEGIYMGRGVYLLKNNELREPIFNNYDHPYFGNIFLASVYKISNFINPNLLDGSSSGYAHNTINLFLYSRIAMGILAVIDTILIFKIIERVYNNKAHAFFAAILFAVMPSTWLSRWIHLDSIMLPFLLGSVLFALWAKNNNSDQKIWLLFVSGISLGIAIFTKIPAFTMIPLIGYIIYSEKKSIRNLGLWFIPVILIPLLWPLYSIQEDQFDQWLDGVNEQLGHLNKQTYKESWPLHLALVDLLKIDPVLVILGIAGSVYALLRRDIFIILFTYPYLFFLFLTNFVSNFHLLLLLISFCIAFSKLILDVFNKGQKIKLLRWPFISILTIFGLATSVIIINNGDNTPYFDALQYAHQYMREQDSNKTALNASPFYVFLPMYLSNSKDFNFWSSFDWFDKPIILQILDPEFKIAISAQQQQSSSTYKKILSEFPMKNLKNFTYSENITLEVVTINLEGKIWNANGTRHIINFTDDKKWQSDGNVRIILNSTYLTMYAKTSDSLKFRNGMTLNEIINTTKIPALLALNYSSLSSSENSKFHIEITDENGSLLWSGNLKHTSGKFGYYLFSIPDTTHGKKVKISFIIVPGGPGKDQLTIRSGVIF